jgi:4-amino-4-deoxy-L-arabinose transferase-like glycosyltransferase
VSRRELLLLFGVALVVRAAAGILITYPPYLDPAYYELVARQLVSGDGFTTPALWSFLEVGGRLPSDPVLPAASNGHWMPLTSVVAGASMAVFGPSHLAAELPSILLGAALVPLTAWLGFELWRSRRVAWVSGLLALFAGPMLVLVPLVDSFALFGLGGCLALVGATRAVTSARGGVWLLMAGAGIGLATLARIDGMVLALAPATAWLVRRGVGPWRGELPPLSWAGAVMCAGAALLVVAPWLVRQQLVFGTPFPSAGGHTLWISSYNEQFSIGHPIDLGTYLASGTPAIIGSKLTSWGLLVGRTAVLLGGTFVASFVYGMWRERRRADLAPFLVYWLALFIVMGGLFTFHAPQGAWYHSAWAWLPFAIPLGVAMFEPGVAALGRRVRLFSRERNRRFLFNAAVIGAVVLSIVGSFSLVAGWSADRARLERAVPFLESVDPADVVMYVDPPALTLATGLRSVAPPFDPFPVIGDVVDAYDVGWVVLERPAGAAEDVLGLWDGSASVDPAGNRAAFLADTPAFEAEGIRIYATVDSGP